MPKVNEWIVASWIWFGRERIFECNTRLWFSMGTLEWRRYEYAISRISQVKGIKMDVIWFWEGWLESAIKLYSKDQMTSKLNLFFFLVKDKRKWKMLPKNNLDKHTKQRFTFYRVGFDWEKKIFETGINLDSEHFLPVYSLRYLNVYRVDG